jgi:uncharacterized protein YqhQ
MDKTFETEVLTRLAVIESKLDGYKELKTVAYSADTRSKENKSEIEELKEKNKWLSRTIIGAVIGEIVAIIFLVVKIGLGV